MSPKRISRDARHLIVAAVTAVVFMIGLFIIDSLRADFVSAVSRDTDIPDSLLTYLAYYAALAGVGAGCIVNFWLAQ